MRRRTILANETLLQRKYARIVALFAQQAQISLEQALDFFYKSDTYLLMSEGVGDMHCYGDLYLVDELLLEKQQEP